MWARWIAALTLALAILTSSAGSAEAHGAFGPLHRYLYATAPYPWLQDEIIQCESEWTWNAWNPSGASGLAQFMPGTWAWGQELFGIYGSPYDPYVAIDMMNAFARAGMLHHWSCYWIVVYGFNPDY